MAQRFLGIDTGGTIAKAAVIDLDGREIVSDRRANRVHFPATGHTEIDAEALWQAARAAIRGVLERCSTDPPGAAMGVAMALGHDTSLKAAMAGMVRIARSDAPGPAQHAACHTKSERFSSPVTILSAAPEGVAVEALP